MRRDKHRETISSSILMLTVPGLWCLGRARREVAPARNRGSRSLTKLLIDNILVFRALFVLVRLFSAQCVTCSLWSGHIIL
ncbi:hypothetical protein RRG08_028909 [Elysia crispata]|uniref:Uncharacterized protein n=1 Tax=Elysia crispata TaxID=231223 RepID=A0AAE1E2D5_9GAST|nr:hypothetical protein RRG08_028909 [Elysia crispata]